MLIPAPMRAPEGLRQPFTDPKWLYEIKFDGCRCMAAIEGDGGFRADTNEERYQHTAARVELLTKSGSDCSTWYPKVLEALAALPGGGRMSYGEDLRVAARASAAPSVVPRVHRRSRSARSTLSSRTART